MTLIRALIRSRPPRCDFEALHALSDPPESSHPCFAMYPRVSDILGEVDERAAALARRSKPLSAILPKKVHRYAVADSQHFSVAQPINPDFARLCGNKVVSGSACSALGSGSSGYQSSHSFGESSGKRSASPVQGGGDKCFQGGKGRAPSSKPSGFRR